MSYTVGEQVTVPISVTVDGVPTNATVSVAVSKPDGSTVSPTVGTTGTGLYEFSVIPDQPSIWGYVATISGAATGRESGEFYVTAAAARVVSLREVKAFLNKDPDQTEDDEELADVIDAAQDMIVRDYGPVLPTVYVERHEVAGPHALLRQRPILGVTSVSRTLYGGTPSVVAPTGYDWDALTGLLWPLSASGARALWSPGYLDVTYRAGRNPVAQNYRLAAKELSGHLWRNTQLGRARRQRSGADDEAATAGLGYSFPYRVRELLGAKPPWVF